MAVVAAVAAVAVVTGEPLGCVPHMSGSPWHSPGLREMPAHGATSCPQRVPPSLGTSDQGVALLSVWGQGERGCGGWQSPLTLCTLQLGPGVPQRGEQGAGRAAGVPRLCPVLCRVRPYRVPCPQGWHQPPLGLSGAGGDPGGAQGRCSVAGAEQNIPSIPEGHLPVLGCRVSPVPMSPRATRYDMESTEHSPGSDKGKERSLEDLNKSTSSSPTQGSSKMRPLTVR